MKPATFVFTVGIAFCLLAAAPLLPTLTPNPYPVPTATRTPTATVPPTAYPPPSTPWPTWPPAPTRTPCTPDCPPPSDVAMTSLTVADTSPFWLVAFPLVLILLPIRLIRYWLQHRQSGQ